MAHVAAQIGRVSGATQEGSANPGSAERLIVRVHSTSANVEAVQWSEGQTTRFTKEALMTTKIERLAAKLEAEAEAVNVTKAFEMDAGVRAVDARLSKLAQYGVSWGAVVMMADGWEGLNEAEEPLSAERAALLEYEGTQLRKMPLAFFSKEFGWAQAWVVKHEFPENRVYFQGKEVELGAPGKVGK